MDEINNDELIEIQACYWGYFLFNKVETDSTYNLPNDIRECLIDFVVGNEIEWLKSSDYDDISYYLINNGCGPIKNFTDAELLSSFLNDNLFTLDINNSKQFLNRVKEALTPIEFIKHSQDLTVLKQMETDGIITSEEALEIFGIALNGR